MRRLSLYLSSLSLYWLENRLIIHNGKSYTSQTASWYWEGPESRTEVWLVPSGPSWWRHQMEIFSTLLTLCAGYSPVTTESSSQRPVTWNFDVFFDLRLDKRLSKQSWGWWLDTTLRSLWRHCNGPTIPHEISVVILNNDAWSTKTNLK